jgi:hypothetical protein
MRTLVPTIAFAAVLLLTSTAQAQPPAQGGDTAQSPPGPSAAPPGATPELGGPLHPATDTGLDKVAADGVSTETVPAVPCSKAARETDGTTTCIGIPGPIRRADPEHLTTGRAR